MVIVELAGGLGNQMFQYAFGRSIALKNSTKLYLDLRYLEKKIQPKDFNFRNYELDCFNCKATILDPEDYTSADELIQSIKSKLFRKLSPARSNYIKEETTKYHAEYISASKNVYLRGYWQNPRYFESSSDQLKNEFQFPKSNSQAVLDIENHIKSSNVAYLKL